MWSFWHLGMWIIASGFSGLDLLIYILAFTVTIVALNMLMVWIYQHTSNSLVPMVLAHFIFNLGAGLIIPGGLGLGSMLPLFGWLAGVFTLVAVIVWVLLAK